MGGRQYRLMSYDAWTKVVARAARISLLKREEGSVAVLGAVLMTALVGTAALSVELGNWYATRVELQRLADMAAIGGAFTFAAQSSAQSATNAAADTAELNGATGGGSRTWNTSTSTLTDGLVSAGIVASPRTPGNQAVSVTVSRSLPLILTKLFSTNSSVTIKASSWAEITPPPPGAPACILALAPLGTGVVNGVTIGGNPTLNLNGCTLRSNSDVDVTGSASVSTLGVYAAGSIAGSNLITTTPSAGQLFGNDGIVPDPYAGDALLQNAFASLGSGGSAVSVSPHGTVTLSPGTYSSIDVKGTAVLQPGTYIVNGPVTFESQAQVSGSGVTIIASGAVTVNGGASLNLSAPTANASSGVPGIVLASPTTASSKINGGSSSAFQGALYFPNANIEFTGNSANGGNGCTQVVADTVTFKGSASLGSNCSAAGTAPINSASNGVTLVQ